MGIENWMSAGAVLDKPLAGGLWRMAPLRGEMTQSFLGRLAAGYGMEFGSLLAAVVDVGGRSNTMGRPQPDSEVFLNRQARECVAALCRVPEEHLARALPAWAQEEPRKRYPGGSAAQFRRTPEMVRPWGPACPGCVVRRARVAGSARLSLGPQDRLCWSHGFWLLQVPGTVGLVVDVSGYREAARARRRHAGLLRRSPVGAAAFEGAQAVTASWWWRAWRRSICGRPGCGRWGRRDGVGDVAGGGAGVGDVFGDGRAGRGTGRRRLGPACRGRGWCPVPAG